jgi:hypothetical protein
LDAAEALLDAKRDDEAEPLFTPKVFLKDFFAAGASIKVFLKVFF